jgi:hypothetical protein
MAERIQDLACYRRLTDRVDDRWPAFQTRRRARLAQGERFDGAVEKVAENVVEDLLTGVLDWTLAEVNNQIGYADMLLTKLGVKYLIIETKRPGRLLWHRPAVEAALLQARRYAGEQKVSAIAVSDGALLYAADVVDGGLRDRAFVRLDDETPEAHELFWLSVDGIYRPRPDGDAVARNLAAAAPPSPAADAAAPTSGLTHPKYHLPATCFAYVGEVADPHTWHLPYRRADGSVDGRRLPKAIQAILTNYRGAKVQSVPEAAIPDVLVCLARAAAETGKLPGQGGGKVSPVYARLHAALDQLERLGDVLPGDAA